MELILDLKKRYTYADYLTWADEQVRELIDRFIKVMLSPAKPIHQELSASLIYKLKRLIFKNKGNGISIKEIFNHSLRV